MCGGIVERCVGLFVHGLSWTPKLPFSESEASIQKSWDIDINNGHKIAYSPIDTPNGRIVRFDISLASCDDWFHWGGDPAPGR